MIPASFSGSNVVYAKNQPQYLPLPAHNGIDGRVTTCWTLTLRERVKVLLTGRMWLQQLAFGAPLQPQRPSADRPILQEAG